MRIPDLIVAGENFPASNLRLTLSSLVGMIQMAVLLLTVGGGFFQPIRDHPLYALMQRYKILIILGAFVGLNIVKSVLEATGAFEVFLNGELIFSKLETGRFPGVEELISQIKA